MQCELGKHYAQKHCVRWSQLYSGMNQIKKVNVFFSKHISTLVNILFVTTTSNTTKLYFYISVFTSELQKKLV